MNTPIRQASYQPESNYYSDYQGVYESNIIFYDELEEDKEIEISGDFIFEDIISHDGGLPPGENDDFTDIPMA
jgi:hypothetical protein